MRSLQESSATYASTLIQNTWRWNFDDSPADPKHSVASHDRSDHAPPMAMSSISDAATPIHGTRMEATLKTPRTAACDNSTDSGFMSAALPSENKLMPVATSELLSRTERATSLTVLDQPIPLPMLDRFNDLTILYSPDLHRAISKKSAGNAGATMKLKWMAPEHDAGKKQLYILIFCDKKISRTVRKFFNKSHVLEELRDDFKVHIVESPVVRLVNPDPIEIMRNGSEPLDTVCGMRIEMRAGDSTATATLGGLICVTIQDKDIIFGITAAHPLALLSPQAEDLWSDIEYSSGSDLDSDSDSGTSVSATCPPADIVINFPHQSTQIDESDGSNSPIETPKNVGTLLTSSIEVSMSGPNRDWALICLDESELRSNSIHLTDPTTTRPYISTIYGCVKVPLGSVCRSAVITSRGVLHGSISANGSRVTTFPSSEFVEAMDFTPSDGERLLQGDSGAWVIDLTTLKLCGHIISVDALGEGYVMPIQDLFDDIKFALGATSIGLAPESFKSRETTGATAKVVELDWGPTTSSEVGEKPLEQNERPLLVPEGTKSVATETKVDVHKTAQEVLTKGKEKGSFDEKTKKQLDDEMQILMLKRLNAEHPIEPHEETLKEMNEAFSASKAPPVNTKQSSLPSQESREAIPTHSKPLPSQHSPHTHSQAEPTDTRKSRTFPRLRHEEVFFSYLEHEIDAEIKDGGCHVIPGHENEAKRDIMELVRRAWRVAEKGEQMQNADAMDLSGDIHPGETVASREQLAYDRLTAQREREARRRTNAEQLRFRETTSRSIHISKDGNERIDRIGWVKRDDGSIRSDDSSRHGSRLRGSSPDSTFDYDAYLFPDPLEHYNRPYSRPQHMQNPFAPPTQSRPGFHDPHTSLSFPQAPPAPPSDRMRYSQDDRPSTHSLNQAYPSGRPRRRPAAATGRRDPFTDDFQYYDPLPIHARNPGSRRQRYQAHFSDQGSDYE